MVRNFVMVFAMLIILAGCENQTNTPALTEDEQKIADALIPILHDVLEQGTLEEFPIVFLSADTVVLLDDIILEISYVQGYVWRSYQFPCPELLALAPEGIACFMRAPAPSWDGYFVVNMGKKDDGSYYTHIYDFYPDWDSLEMHIENAHPIYPVDDNIQTFELYIPPR